MLRCVRQPRSLHLLPEEEEEIRAARVPPELAAIATRTLASPPPPRGEASSGNGDTVSANKGTSLKRQLRGFTMKLVIIGRTGRIGSKLVTRLREQGH